MSTTKPTCYSFACPDERKEATEELTRLITEGVDTIAIGWNYNDEGEVIGGKKGNLRVLACKIGEKNATTIGSETFKFGQVPLELINDPKYSIPIDSRGCRYRLKKICEEHSLVFGIMRYKYDNKFQVYNGFDCETMGEVFITLMNSGQLEHE